MHDDDDDDDDDDVEPPSHTHTLPVCVAEGGGGGDTQRDTVCMSNIRWLFIRWLWTDTLEEEGNENTW